jgi:hypothetical protein
MHNRTGNLPSLPGIFPGYAAPIVRNTADGQELTMARWGMPSRRFPKLISRRAKKRSPLHLAPKVAPAVPRATHSVSRTRP